MQESVKLHLMYSCNLSQNSWTEITVTNSWEMPLSTNNLNYLRFPLAIEDSKVGLYKSLANFGSEIYMNNYLAY